MTDPFVAEIRIFAGNFAPVGWAFCNGQLMPISQNTALFSLLGTNYGGDGKTTFALPNLQGAAPMNQGDGPGLTPRVVGESGGSDMVTLLEAEIPNHTHSMMATPSPASARAPASNTLARSRNGNAYQTQTTQNITTMSPQALGLAGGSQPHNNMQPYLTLNFIIAMQGIYPPRS
jgi:microcystin-dependent protein